MKNVKTEFYYNLYLLAVKKQIIDGENNVNINENYFITTRIKDSSIMANDYPLCGAVEIDVEVFSKNSPLNPEHLVKFLKSSNLFEKSKESETVIVSNMTERQKVEFILSKEKTKMLDKPCLIEREPIHRIEISNELISAVAAMAHESLQDLKNIYDADKTSKAFK